MTGQGTIEKKLAFIEACVADMRRMGRPDLLHTDLKERRFIEHSLQIAIQAVLDVCARIASERRLPEPRTNYDAISSLEREGVLPSDLSAVLKRMVGFRNILVHGYADVDPARVREIVETRLDDLLAFATTVRARLPARD